MLWPVMVFFQIRLMPYNSRINDVFYNAIGILERDVYGDFLDYRSLGLLIWQKMHSV